MPVWPCAAPKPEIASEPAALVVPRLADAQLQQFQRTSASLENATAFPSHSYDLGPSLNSSWFKFLGEGVRIPRQAEQLKLVALGAG